MIKKLLTGACVSTALAVSTLSAQNTFKFSFQGDLKGLDPHGLYETFQLYTMANVYEPLINKDKNLKYTPALATSWKPISDTKWEVKIRKGVKFHGGEDLTAEDVVFTFERAKGTDLAIISNKFKNIYAKDKYTVIFETPDIDPLAPGHLTSTMIMDKGWTIKHKADKPKPGATNLYTHLNTNGTGPFKAISYKAGVGSVFTRFDGYWDKNIPTNVDRIEFTPIPQDSTRVAALLSGKVDMAFPIPIQDKKRIERSKKVKALIGPETRTVFIGFDQFRDELVGSSVKGKNPFKDKRVREAFIRAVNIKAINKKIMKNMAFPTSILVASGVNGYDESIAAPYKYDLKKAKKLMKEAGYGKGFSLIMDCPNNRYVNDEKICQAVVSMLAKIKVKADLNAQPKNKFFAKITKQGGYDTSFYMLGWSPASVDAGASIADLATCRRTGRKTGVYNIGDYCNPKIQEYVDLINKEVDTKKRNALIKTALKTIKDDYGYMALHNQSVFWGVKKDIELDQRPDNVLDWRSIVMR